MAGKKYYFLSYNVDESAANTMRADVTGGFMSARCPDAVDSA